VGRSLLRLHRSTHQRVSGATEVLWETEQMWVMFTRFCFRCSTEKYHKPCFSSLDWLGHFRQSLCKNPAATLRVWAARLIHLQTTTQRTGDYRLRANEFSNRCALETVCHNLYINSVACCSDARSSTSGQNGSNDISLLLLLFHPLTLVLHGVPDRRLTKP
jgi:hypothetical protein